MKGGLGMFKRALVFAAAVGIVLLPLGAAPHADAALLSGCAITSNHIVMIGGQGAADAWTTCDVSQHVQITILLTPWNGSGTDAVGYNLPFFGCSYTTCIAATANYSSSSSHCWWSNVYAVSEYGQYMYNGSGACF